MGFFLRVKAKNCPAFLTWLRGRLIYWDSISNESLCFVHRVGNLIFRDIFFRSQLISISSFCPLVDFIDILPLQVKYLIFIVEYVVMPGCQQQNFTKVGWVAELNGRTIVLSDEDNLNILIEAFCHALDLDSLGVLAVSGNQLQLINDLKVP